MYFVHSYGIVVDGEGNVLIGDYANKRIAMFRSDGSFVWMVFILNTHIIVCVCSTIPHELYLYVFTLLSQVRSIGADSGSNKLEGPQGLALDDEGKLWITDITTGIYI